MTVGSVRTASDIRSLRIYSGALSADDIAWNAKLDEMRFGPNAANYRWNADKQCVEYQVSAQGTDGATVSLDGETYAQSVATAWTELGTPVTVTVSARPPQGCSISAWEGVPTGATAVRNDKSITLTLTDAAVLKPIVHTCTTLYWRGTKDALASKAANWADAEGNVSASAPFNGDAVVFDAQSGAKAMTWDIDDVELSGWTQDADYTGTVTFKTGLSRMMGGTAYTAYGCLDEDGVTRVLRVTGDVTLNGGTWTHAQQPDVALSPTEPAYIDAKGIYRLVARVGGDFTIGADAKINVTKCGFRKGGPGNGGGGGSCGHGGGNGLAYRTDSIGAAGGRCYGATKSPVSLGTGVDANKIGGGSVELKIDGALAIDGPIVANGATSHYTGSGGSVYLVARSISGAGSVTANGGGGSGYFNPGGGGRVAVKLTGEGKDFSEFTGTLAAAGGNSGSRGCARAGTVYRETLADKGAGELLIIGNGHDDGNNLFYSDWNATVLTGEDANHDYRRIVLSQGAMLAVGTGAVLRVDTNLEIDDATYDRLCLFGGSLQVEDGYEFKNMQIRSLRPSEKAAVVFGGDRHAGTTVIGEGCSLYADYRQIFDNLKIKSGGKITHLDGSTPWFDSSSDVGSISGAEIEARGDMTIDEGGAVDVSGCGYRKSFGFKPGNGHSYGGSHGGKAYKAPDMRCYGSIKHPFACGSGPGYLGRGGGRVKLFVDGNLTVNGTVDATAQIGTGWTGGGAGGSVWISAGKLVGGGEIKADGSHVVNSGGECGGGGRISLIMTGEDSVISDFTGKVHANGGRNASLTGEIRGGAGTIYVQEGGDGEDGGTLIIDGGLESGSCAQTEITTDVTDTSFDTVIITNGASLKQYQDTTVTVRKDWLNYGTYAAEIADSEHAAATVVFTNAEATSHVVGQNPFAAFTCETPGKRFAFGTGAKDALSIVAGGKLLLQGEDADGKRIELGPDTADAKWTISIADGAAADMEGLSVTWSDASASPTKPTAKNSVDSGDNDEWTFVNIKVGEVITWTGAVSASWNQPGNWTTEEGKARVPAETDKVVIPAGTPNVPALGEPLTVATLTVATGAALDLATYDLTVTDTLTVNGSMLARKAETIELRGDVSFAANAFACARSTIVLTGADDKTADFGDNVLWDIRFVRDGTTTAVTGGFTARRVWAQPAAATVLAFAKDVSVTSHEWWLGGIDGASPLLSLVSATEGEKWNLTAVSHAWVRGVRVRDSNAAGGNAVFAQEPSEGLAGNVNWRFGVVATEWTGESDTAFENPSNWSTGKVPGADDLAVLGEGAEIVVPAGGATVGELHVEGASAVFGGRLTTVGSAYVRCGELTLDAPLAVGQDLDVRTGGSITHTANGAVDSHRVDISVARDLYVWPDGRIQAIAKGYSAGKGPGSPDGTSAGSSHGGRGDGGVCYGSFRHPVESGSGGGSWNGAGKVFGGGVISIDVKGTTTVEGEVSANGERKEWYGPSGGSVCIVTGSLAGDGTISANGGDLKNGGLGGGGRVAVYLTDAAATFDSFVGAITAYGGRSDSTNYTPGSSGTVFLSLASDPEDGGTLHVFNDVPDKFNSKYGNGTDFPLVNETDHRQNANLKVVIGKYGYVVSRRPITVRELEMSDSTGKLNLNGKELSILSTKHRDRSKPKDALGHWKGDWPGTVNYDTAGSTIRWGGGFLLFVK